jgi:hypothetical protein
MAKHVCFEESNFLLRAAPSPGDTVDSKTNEVISNGIRIGDLHVYKDNEQTVSCWQLTAEEMLEVVRTGRVYVFVLGDLHPPIYVSATLMQKPEEPAPAPDA